MNAKKMKFANKTLIYVVIILVVAALLIWFYNDPSTHRMVPWNHSFIGVSWNWTQILISLGIGFLLGVLFSKRK
ncbi:MAG: hypothetical protein RBR35_18035 [Salinivirgaceae bacterium]|nr:hypothetical protein [Salinivirgaceae bacterium]